MPTKPNKNLDILNRRQQVAHLYLQNWTQAQIAEQLGVGQPTISDHSLIPASAVRRGGRSHRRRLALCGIPGELIPITVRFRHNSQAD